MLQGWVVVAVAFSYIGLQFVVASYGDRVRQLDRIKSLAVADLSALTCDLVRVVDVLRLGGFGFTHRLRLPHYLSRANPNDRAWLAADHAHRAAGQDPEHHLDRGLHRGALWQEPNGGDNRLVLAAVRRETTSGRRQ